MLFITTFFIGSSTLFPSLAYSYNFFPFTLTALYIGTSILYSPINEFKTSSINSLLMFVISSFSKTLPVISNVSVFIPSVTSAIYSLFKLVISSTSFNALLTAITKMPLAIGSSVPV